MKNSTYKKADLEKIKSLKNLLTQNFKHPANVELLSRAIQMNDHKMQELFKVETGCTIYRFHFIERMKEACRLLIDTDELLKNISGMVGYKNATSFINAFKDVYGVTPDEYRKDPVNHMYCKVEKVAGTISNN
ncbi:AraC-like DNA-binding protein [Filimonas zeae]|uniref:HTH araC/xylS-type domain-containing protein n=1 Tax=Filimonas zeae TaxID=1737353 RepID=A0A917J7K9_9BACT|nr:AraC family transcriptional regulator [Filimonas zeae]MDR6342984.1 AraC-like DNA-binding protein [Filimonas zeae]GGH83487.1 hypothetical protein GCM10011379_58950 [Filimonas zeae]